MTSRYDLIEAPVACMIRILRESTWYQMRPLMYSVLQSKRIIARLRRKGRVVNVTWVEGMG